MITLSIISLEISSWDISGACCVETTTKGLSENVIVNGIGIHRQDDLNTPHTFSPPDCPSHQTKITTGSTTVFANGKGVARVADLYDGGEEVKTGSPDVFAGG